MAQRKTSKPEAKVPAPATKPPSAENPEDFMDFEIRVLRDQNERPSVIACKQPTPSMGVSFDLKVSLVDHDEVRVEGSVEPRPTRGRGKAG